MTKETERQKLINQIINLSSDEFETKEDYLNLAKLSDYQLRNNLISINNYILNQ
jgi:hypothetical protein